MFLNKLIYLSVFLLFMSDRKIITFSSLYDMEINVKKDVDYFPFLEVGNWWRLFARLTQRFGLTDFYQETRKEIKEFGKNNQNKGGVTFLTNIKYIDKSPRRTVFSISQFFDDPIKNLYLASHEESHAIDFLKKIDRLEEVIIDSGCILKKRMSEMGFEEKAEIGGLWRLFCEGYDIPQIREHLPLKNLDYLLSLFPL